MKCVVAVVLKNRNNPDEFLVVRRPDSDPDLGGCWGLPATTMHPGELPEDAARRVCREKLQCDAYPMRFLGIMSQRRNGYDISLMDIDMVIADSQQPKVGSSDTDGTVYVDQKWSTNPADLRPSAEHGSCCSSIFLTDRGLMDRDEWVASLEGSSTAG